jgi:hypothetical protein
MCCEQIQRKGWCLTLPRLKRSCGHIKSSWSCGQVLWSRCRQLCLQWHTTKGLGYIHLCSLCSTGPTAYQSLISHPHKSWVMVSPKPTSEYNFFKFVSSAQIAHWCAESNCPHHIVKDCQFEILMKAGWPSTYIPSPSTVYCDIKALFEASWQRIDKI